MSLRALTVLVTGAVLVSGCTCGPPHQGALRVITEDTPSSASCVSLDLLTRDGAPLTSLRFATVAGTSEYISGIAQGDLPGDVGLRARAFEGHGCDEPLVADAESALVVARFDRGAVNEIRLTLAPLASPGDGGVADAGPSDAGPSDAGPSDAGLPDGGPFPGTDGGVDGGTSDAGASDAGASDAGSSDAGASDGGVSDAGAGDAGRPDSGVDAGPPTDVDQDGYASLAAGGTDCDDSDPTIHPGATEDCFGGADRNCDGLRGCADPTCASMTCSSLAMGLAFTTAPLTAPAGSCRGPVSVGLVDDAGLPARRASATTVSMQANPAARATLYADATCDGGLGALTLPATATSASFWLLGRSAGSAQLTASSSGLSSATQTETFSPAPPVSLAITSPARTVAAGACSASVVVEARDVFGAPAAVTTPSALTITTPGSTGLAFFSDPACGTSATPLWLDAGQSATSFSFTASTARLSRIAVDGGVLGVVTQDETVIAGPAVGLAITSAPQSIVAGGCSGPITIEARDAFGNVVALSAPVSVALNSTVDGGLSTFTDAGCGVPGADASIAANGSGTLFSLLPTLPGPFSVSASSPGLASATQTEQATLPGKTPYGYRRILTITTGANTPRGGYVGYTMTATLDTAALITQGHLRADGNDLRLFHWNGTGWTELDREVAGLNTTSTTVRFACADAIPALGTDSLHALFYGSVGASTPPSDLSKVYVFADDFESGTLSKWTVVSGLWAQATDRAHGGSTHALKYPAEGNAERWIVTNPPVLETDLLWEAWWNVDTIAGTDFSQMARVQPGSPLNEYETNLEGTTGWNVAKEIGGAWTEVAVNGGTPAADTWTHIGIAVIGNTMKTVKDGVQVAPASGFAAMTPGLDGGTVGFRKWAVPATQAVWLDDVTLRRYIEPEPVVTVGAEEIVP